MHRLSAHLNQLQPGLCASSSSSSSSYSPRDVLILSVARTPIGSFQGSLSSLTAPELGGAAVKAAVQRAGIQPNQVEDCLFGLVCSAGVGQNAAGQVVISSGLSPSVNSTTINKVCSSGLKSISLAAQSITTGAAQCVVAGGMESMSNIPYYLPSKARSGLVTGSSIIEDGMMKDGLTDPFHKNTPMGIWAEQTVKSFSFTRQQQDAYALQSYERALNSIDKRHFQWEITPVKVKNKSGQVKTVENDEEPGKLQKDKVSRLKPSFIPEEKGGSITAVNSSKLSDGAAALVLCSGEFAIKHGLKPIGKILSYADAQRVSNEFPIAPASAIPIALKRAGIESKQVDYWEINEAFAAVALANQQLLDLPSDKLNVHGGAVALGHPIGCSGARIVVTLMGVLKQNKGKIGCAAICNGTGGATCVVVQSLMDS
jgi:acetyl-CoA C-acetyltransferase